MNFLFYKKGLQLTVIEEQAEEFMKLENGIYTVTLKKSRNLQHHRKFFAILKGWAEWRGYDLLQALLVLKILLGEVQQVEYMGKQITIPKSISFESMNEVEFNEFYQKAILFLASDMGMTPIELEQGVEE